MNPAGDGEPRPNPSMLREPHIPLFLWLATAVLVHLTWFGGTDRAVAFVEEREELVRFASNVLAEAQHSNAPLQVDLLENPAPVEPPQAPAVPPKAEPAQECHGADCEPPPEETPPEPVPTPPKVDEPPPTPELPHLTIEKPKPKPVEKPKPPEPAKTPEQPKPVAADKPKEPEQAPPPVVKEPPPPAGNRIAVVQHVENDKQPDNPNAALIADQANHVKEETQASVTSHDHNDPNPTPGQSHMRPSPVQGNADETRLGDGEDAPDKPGVSRPPPQRMAALAPAPLPGPRAATPPGNPTSGDRGSPKPAPRGQMPAQDAVAPRRAEEAVEASPDKLTAGDGPFSVPGPQEARAAVTGRSGKKKRLPPPLPDQTAIGWLGFGSTATTPGGVNLNLSPTMAVAAIGADQLVAERQKQGERLRSKHRGAFKTHGLERWRAAIENYVPSVKTGNQTALNTARVPFAAYLNQIHNRIHPIFAEGFLESLDRQGAGDPINRPDMKTFLEIVVSQEDGRLVRMGITQTSGVTRFDVGALESVDQAAPFGKPPAEIVSPDGNVYLHWEFYRNPMFACSTFFARPFMLKAQPKTAPAQVHPEGQPPPPSQQGFLLPRPHPTQGLPLGPNGIGNLNPRLGVGRTPS